MSQEDTTGLAKIIGFIRAVSILIGFMHLYWFCYEWFYDLG